MMRQHEARLREIARDATRALERSEWSGPMLAPTCPRARGGEGEMRRDEETTYGETWADVGEIAPATPRAR